MSHRVCVVTAGHLSTCPRMLKVADACVEAGYRVRVVSARSGGWMAEADEAIAATRDWRWRVVDYGSRDARVTWWRSGVRHRLARACATITTALPMPVLVAAFARLHHELVEAILEEPAELIYGGTTGAIAATAEAARRRGCAFAIDLEDFHCAEHVSPDGDLSNALGRSVMQWASDGAAFVTAGSAAIAEACRNELGIRAVAVNNVFPLPASAPAPVAGAGAGAFAAYWFSQTIGPNRGLEDVVSAFGLTTLPAVLTLRGSPLPGYVESLRSLAAASAPRVDIRLLPPAPPSAMVDECRAFDVGVSAEQGPVRNRLLSLSNKAATYPLAGLPVVMTDTPGQRALSADLGPGALVFTPGDCAGLARQLVPLMTDRECLARARTASWEAAKARWHWEHPLERGAVLSAVGSVLG